MMRALDTGTWVQAQRWLKFGLHRGTKRANYYLLLMARGNVKIDPMVATVLRGGNLLADCLDQGGEGDVNMLWDQGSKMDPVGGLRANLKQLGIGGTIYRWTDAKGSDLCNPVTP